MVKWSFWGVLMLLAGLSAFWNCNMSHAKVEKEVPYSADSIAKAEEKVPYSADSIARAEKEVPYSADSIAKAEEKVPYSADSIAKAEEKVSYSADSIAKAKEYLDDFSLDEIDEALGDIKLWEKKSKVSFSEAVEDSISDEEGNTTKSWLESIVVKIKNEVVFEKSILLSLCMLALSCAVFTAFTKAFSSKQVSQTGFFVAYLLLFSVISVVFREGIVIAKEVINSFETFMKAVLPAYFLSISVQIGQESSLGMYELALGVLNISGWMLQNMFLPLIQIYFLLVMGQNIAGEDKISHLVNVVEKLIMNGMKLVLGAMVGLQVLEGMVVPMTGQLQKAVLLRGAAAIPGIGNAWEGVAKTIFGAGSLIQGAIGSVGVFFLILIGIVPMIKLWLYRAYFSITGILVQPVSDKRVTKCIEGASKASGMLVFAVLISFLTMFFAVAVLAVTMPKGIL